MAMDQFDREAMREGSAVRKMRGTMAVTAPRPKPKRQACKGPRRPITQYEGRTGKIWGSKS